MPEWQTAAEAGKRINKGKRFIQREIKAGRMRGARVGGRGEYLTTPEWVDQWVVDHATPIALPARRRA